MQKMSNELILMKSQMMIFYSAEKDMMITSLPDEVVLQYPGKDYCVIPAKMAKMLISYYDWRTADDPDT
jgi:hypothetical protein